MLKRPLNPRFIEAVRTGRKITTIRDSAWPVGKPIMLYHWSGAAYRSKQIDVAVVEVTETHELRITHRFHDAFVSFDAFRLNTKLLHETEGFASYDDMQAWFRPLVKPGQTVQKHLMRFRLLPTDAPSQ